jgi:hypothetical protein
MTLPLVLSSVLFSSEQLQSLAIVIGTLLFVIDTIPLPILFSILT